MVCVSMMARNSLRTGSGGVGGDQLEAVEQRQAGLDAANDDVDGIRKRVEKFRLAALLQKPQHPERQAEAGGKAEAERRRAVRRRTDIATTKRDDAENAGDDHELPLRPVEPGLREPHRERRPLGLFSPLLDFLERAFDLLAAGFPAAARVGRPRSAPTRATLAMRRSAFFSPDRIRIKEDPGDAADRDATRKNRP